MFTPRKLNRFLMTHIPVAWIAGIRVAKLTDEVCELQLRHRWINQNPFGSVYFAVLAAGGELATGIPLFREVKAAKRPVSMLVTEQQARFLKKARGRVRFVFNDMDIIRQNLQEALDNGTARVFTLTSRALDEQGQTLAEFRFQWSIKPKHNV